MEALSISTILGGIGTVLGGGVAVGQWLKNRGESDGRRSDELAQIRKELKEKLEKVEQKAEADKTQMLDELGKTNRKLDSICRDFALYRFRAREAFALAHLGDDRWKSLSQRLTEDFHEVDDLLPDPTRNLRATVSGRKILYADDATDQRTVVKLGLERAGAVVELAESGQRALELFEIAQQSGHPFDFLLLDFSMPALSGLEVLEEIRRTGNQTPAAIFTAHGEIVTGEIACDVWIKPMAPNQLIARIEALLQ